MMLLIARKLGRLGEGNHSDSDATASELGMPLAHLAEVRLARQSSQVTEKNKQRIFVELRGEINRLTVKID